MTAMQSGAGEASWNIGNVVSTAGAILFGHFGPFFGTALVASLPSLILAAMWAVAIPAAVIEGQSATAALSRSQELTRERRWRVFGAYLVAGLITAVGGAVVGGAVGVVAGVNSTAFLVVVWAFVA